MSQLKFKLTTESRVCFGVTLFRIEATVDIPSRGIKKGDKGGWVEKESNLSHFGNARVSGDAWVSGNAQVSAKKSFTKGWFIGGDDTEKITRIEDQMGTDYWKAQYVLGDYEISDIEEATAENKPELEVIELNGKKYREIKREESNNV